MRPATARALIRYILEEISLWSEDAEQLVIETGYYESDLKYLDCIDEDDIPFNNAVGYTQLRESTIIDIWDRLQRGRVRNAGLITRKLIEWGFNPDNPIRSVSLSIALQFAFSRLKYFLIDEPLPIDLKTRAWYYGKYYFTDIDNFDSEKYINKVAFLENR